MTLRRLHRWAAPRKTWIIFIGILLLGVFARTWEFRTLPPGLHQDEAAIAMDAYDLYHFGVDRNNISYPIHMVGWGNGQNAPYAYFLIPFIALFGLSVPVIRLPILLSGIATLPLVFLIFRRTVDEKFGLFAMFCIAISPWGILLSRWGLESNLLPFFFSAGYFFLLKSLDDWRWFIPANILFAFCLYTYGTTYAFLPMFMLFTIIILYWYRIMNVKQILTGLAVLFVCGFPMILFVAINLFGGESIHIGPITIPHMPTLSRFQQQGVVFRANSFNQFVQNFQGMMGVLFYQDDFRARNVFPPYGYFYGISFPIAILGLVGLLRSMSPKREEKLLWIVWLVCALILGTLQPAIVNRLNILFIPLIALIAYFPYWLTRYFRYALSATVVILLIAFSFFTYSYHSEAYQLAAGKEFYTGLLPALRLAQQQTDGPICVTNYKVYMPYIFVLYTERTPPQDYLSKLHYTEPVMPLREVDHLGRYTFGLENCGDHPDSAYVLFRNERPEHPGNYKRLAFDYFTLYLPRE